MTDTTSHPTTTIPKADPQAEIDTRGIFLNTVGIDRVIYPARISGWEEDASIEQRSQATFSLSVSLNAEKRGIHMSRLIEVLHAWEQPHSLVYLPYFLTQLRKQQGATYAEMSCNFHWFAIRPAPQTKFEACQALETTWHAKQSENEPTTLGYTLRVPVTTLCPCSKEISDYGAHSQRSWITVKIEWQDGDRYVAPAGVFEILSQCASAPIYPLLKRADERHVTMQAYENPGFVEDVARRAAHALNACPDIADFHLHIRNEESIHTHDAIATYHSSPQR
jgi:GTP cyclohydrolase I